MWKYEQKSGAIIRPDGTLLAVGYSGRVPDGVNNPEKQCERDVGPIPRGYYTIERPKNSSQKKYYMRLTSHPETDTCGRDEFQIHGDNRSHTASTGCIAISPRALREEIWNSSDHVLRVVRDSVNVTDAKLRRAPVTAFNGATSLPPGVLA
jgi:hypothetical protein